MRGGALPMRGGSLCPRRFFGARWQRRSNVRTTQPRATLLKTARIELHHELHCDDLATVASKIQSQEIARHKRQCKHISRLTLHSQFQPARQLHRNETAREAKCNMKLGVGVAAGMVH